MENCICFVFIIIHLNANCQKLVVGPGLVVSGYFCGHVFGEKLYGLYKIIN